MKQLLRIGLSIGVSFAILGLLLKMVTTGLDDQQRPSVLSALQDTSLGMVFAVLIVYLITLFIRAYRYRLLLVMSGEQNVPSFRQMSMVTGIRNMIVDMLPARIGELGYVGLLNRGYGVKLQHCVSSLTISVAFDFVALLFVVLLILGKQLSDGSIEGWAMGALLMALIVSAIAIIGLFVITPIVAKWLSTKYLTKLDETSRMAKLITLIQDFGNSITAVREAGKTPQVLGLSIVIRLLKYFGFYLLFRAVSVPNFPDLASLPVEQVVSGLIGGEVGASLPIPTFMSFGAYEAGGALILQLLGVANGAAVVVTLLCVHIWSQFMEYVIGGALLALFLILSKRSKNIRQSVRFEAVEQPNKPRKADLARWLSFGTAGAVFMAGSMFLAWELRAAKKLGSIAAPDVGGTADNVEDWKELSKEHVSNINGFVVFSSNRDGNHDIFKLNLGDFKLSKVTTHPHTETYPRISPDGKRLVFSRSQQPWVSQRNTVAWDIYVLDLATGMETQVGKNGTSPNWINNTEISYLRDATTVDRVNVETMQSSVLYQTGLNNNMPAGAHISNPKYNPLTDQLVFTGRQSEIGMNKGHWGTAITFGNNHKGVENGCELGWSSDNTRLFQVTHGGYDDGKPGAGIKIVSVDPETLESKTMIDLIGEFSHEYWPKESNNGEYMVFGASRGSKHHEHDSKDYEIFLWKRGTDSDKATRLTFHTGNDNWPDIFVN